MRENCSNGLTIQARWNEVRDWRIGRKGVFASAFSNEATAERKIRAPLSRRKLRIAQYVGSLAFVFFLLVLLLGRRFGLGWARRRGPRLRWGRSRFDARSRTWLRRRGSRFDSRRRPRLFFWRRPRCDVRLAFRFDLRLTLGNRFRFCLRFRPGNRRSRGPRPRTRSRFSTRRGPRFCFRMFRARGRRLGLCSGRRRLGDGRSTCLGQL